MKLLVLAPQPFFQDRGTPIATLKLLHILASEGHTIDLLTYHEGDDISIPNCRHWRIPRLPLIRNVPPGFSLRKLICDVAMTMCAVRLCLRREYHVIHAVEESVFMAMLIRAMTGIPYIYDMDSSLPQQLQDRFPPLRLLSPLLTACERRAVRNSQGVVAVCLALEDVAASHSNTVPIVRIEDASLLTHPQASPGGTSDLASLPANIDGPILMYVGNLQAYQGIDLLLDAFVHVYHRSPDVQLVIVGGSKEDINKYRLRAQKIGIDERTHFLGPRSVEYLGGLLQQADVLISPRIMGNNTPMKVFSYLESGTPVLATRLSMHTQVLDDEIALLTEPNPLEMARGICRLLADDELRSGLAKSAAERVSREFHADRLDSKLSEFYHELAHTLGCR